jgi:hypothetical protein
MDFQRLLIISLTASGVSIVLLGVYWLLTRVRSKNSNRRNEAADLHLKLEEHLRDLPRQTRSKYLNLMLVKLISSAMLIVSLSFFIVGGISTESSPQEIRFTISDPAVQVSIFGWSLWGLSLLVLFVAEGAAALLARGIVARHLPGFTKLRFISGKEAIIFGIIRIIIGIFFVTVILLMFIFVTWL